MENPARTMPAPCIAPLPMLHATLVPDAEAFLRRDSTAFAPCDALDDQIEILRQQSFAEVAAILLDGVGGRIAAVQAAR